MADSEELIQLILVDPSTNKPFDEDDPIFITQDEFNFIAEGAAERGTTFDEEFSRIIRAGMGVDQFNREEDAEDQVI